ncbi:hypothetical protein Ciccas_009373 [Cichlidogyrus casuarinus]|uniref:PID domain-containing protein n=1 Tax=Cichlidogyrus casuarinus TaxID=1844966 RepID=A0ABD2Q002_9PLAT
MSLTLSSIRRTLTFRRKRRPVQPIGDEKPLEYKQDEDQIRANQTCQFKVKYLGSIEVFESRGVEKIEQAILALHKQRKFPHNLLKRKSRPAVLVVGGTSLKVYQHGGHNILLDQTIDKVSFCAPDRKNDRGFGYICRDGVAQKWICHAFLSIGDQVNVSFP